jgi:hypothetical protein
MINTKSIFTLIAVASLMLAVTASAAEKSDKSYRAVGTVMHATDASIMLRTSAQDMDFTRDAKTKVNGELKKGAVVTVMYTKVSGQPHATEVTVGAPAKPAKGH